MNRAQFDDVTTSELEREARQLRAQLSDRLVCDEDDEHWFTQQRLNEVEDELYCRVTEP